MDYYMFFSWWFHIFPWTLSSSHHFQLHWPLSVNSNSIWIQHFNFFTIFRWQHSFQYNTQFSVACGVFGWIRRFQLNTQFLVDWTEWMFQNVSFDWTVSRQVAAKPELYPVVLMKRSIDSPAATLKRQSSLNQSLLGRCGATSQSLDVVNCSDDKNTNGGCHTNRSTMINEEDDTTCHGSSVVANHDGLVTAEGRELVYGGHRQPRAGFDRRRAIKTSKSVNEACTMQHPWMPPYQYYGYRSGNVQIIFRWKSPF